MTEQQLKKRQTALPNIFVELFYLTLDEQQLGCADFQVSPLLLSEAAFSSKYVKSKFKKLLFF